MPQSFFFNTDHQLEAVNATPLYPKPLITALADMKIILFSKTFLSMNFRMVQIPTGPQQISIFRTYFRLCTLRHPQILSGMERLKYVIVYWILITKIEAIFKKQFQKLPQAVLKNCEKVKS